MTVTEHVTLIFVLLAIGSVALEFWLSRRNAAHVIAHRDHIPTELSSAISPEAHYKAADYTIARSRFGRLQMLVSLALLLAWTVGGGLQLLNSLVSPLATAWGPLGYQLALLFCFSLIGGLIQLPFEAYEHFRLEERFGFNRMTPKIWVLDLAKNFFFQCANRSTTCRADVMAHGCRWLELVALGLGSLGRLQYAIDGGIPDLDRPALQ